MCMLVSEVYGSLIVREGRILMLYNEEKQLWDVPNDECVKGELGADAACRAAEEHTECQGEIIKYHKSLKTGLSKDGEELTWQPYEIDIKGSPDKGEWVPLDDLEEKSLMPHIEEIKDKIVKRL